MYLAKDGTEIEDEIYFETIESQTLFVIASDAMPVKTGKYSPRTLNNSRSSSPFYIFFFSSRFSIDVRSNKKCAWKCF